MPDNKPTTEKIDNSPEAVEMRKQKAYQENPDLKIFDDASEQWDKKLSGKSCKELYKIEKEAGKLDVGPNDSLASAQNAKLISIATKLDMKRCHER